MIQVECTDPSGYEWLLKKGQKYEVDSWHNDTIVIKHPTCGNFGLFSNRFKVVGNIELFTLRRGKVGTMSKMWN